MEKLGKNKVDNLDEDDSVFYTAPDVLGSITGSSKSEKEDPVPHDPYKISGLRKFFIIVVMYVGMFHIFGSLTGLAPFFSLQAKKKDANDMAAGFVLAVFDLATVFAAPFIPSLECKIRPNHLIAGGLALSGVLTFVFGFTVHIQGGKAYLAICFILRILNGASSACFIIVIYAELAMLFPDRIGSTYALIETAMNLGAMAGLLFGGALFESGGYLGPFAYTGGILMGTGVVLFVLLPNFEKQNAEQQFSLLGFFMHFHPIICGVAITTSQVLAGFLGGSLDSFVEQFKLGAIFVSLLYVMESASYTLTGPMWGYLNDHGLDPHIGCLFGFCICGVGFFFVGPSVWLPMESSLGLTTGSVILCGLGEAAVVINGYNAMLLGASIRGYPDERRMFILAAVVFSVCISSGLFIGSIAGSYFENRMGLRSGSMIIVGMEILVLLLFVVLNIWRRVKGLPIEKDFERRRAARIAIVNLMPKIT